MTGEYTAAPFRTALEGRDPEGLVFQLTALFPRYSKRSARRFIQNVQSGEWQTLSLDQADELAMLLDRSLETFYPEEG